PLPPSRRQPQPPMALHGRQSRPRPHPFHHHPKSRRDRRPRDSPSQPRSPRHRLRLHLLLHLPNLHIHIHRLQRLPIHHRRRTPRKHLHHRRSRRLLLPRPHRYHPRHLLYETSLPISSPMDNHPPPSSPQNPMYDDNYPHPVSNPMTSSSPSQWDMNPTNPTPPNHPSSQSSRTRAYTGYTNDYDQNYPPSTYSPYQPQPSLLQRVNTTTTAYNNSPSVLSYGPGSVVQPAGYIRSPGSLDMQYHDHPGSTESRSPPPPSMFGMGETMGKKHEVVHAYEPVQMDELALRPGDLVLMKTAYDGKTHNFFLSFLPFYSIPFFPFLYLFLHFNSLLFFPFQFPHSQLH
ncbi:hypothetical protein BC829DRAFT_392854, partial [Chytridium lagenaria]